MSRHSWWKCECGMTMHYTGAFEWHKKHGEHDRAMREKIKREQDRDAEEPRKR